MSALREWTPEDQEALVQAFERFYETAAALRDARVAFYKGRGARAAWQRALEANDRATRDLAIRMGLDPDMPNLEQAMAEKVDHRSDPDAVAQKLAAHLHRIARNPRQP